jgi:NAD(P)-dependent dehydrogenase (short-subunit alcohol dehydrogenase family)
MKFDDSVAVVTGAASGLGAAAAAATDPHGRRAAHGAPLIRR